MTAEASTPPRTSLRWAPVALVLLASAALVGVRAYRQHGREATPTLKPRPAVVRVAEVRQGTVRRDITLQGQLRARVAAELAPEVTGQVVARLVEPGETVRAGEVLLRLDAAVLAAEARRLEAELAAAHAEEAAAAEAVAFQSGVLERDRILFAGGGISREALERGELASSRAVATADAASRRVEALSEELAAARERYGKHLLIAPWDGAVVAVRLSPGDLARPGVPAVRLVRSGSYRVVARVGQEEARQVVPGTPVTLAGRGGSLSARVSRVAAGLDPAGLTALEIDLSEPPWGLSDGASLAVTLELDSGQGLVVPRRALLEGPEGAWVFTLDRGAARAVPVEVVTRGGDELLVRGDLAPGKPVVVEHPSVLMTLAGGVTVQVAGASDRETAP